jgi:hypothetical protein
VLLLARAAASRASPAHPNATPNPSPPVENTYPPCASIAERTSSSWRSSAGRIASGTDSHNCAERSISVNKNVTVPEGGCGTRRNATDAGDYPAFHTENSGVSHNARPRTTRPGCPGSPAVWRADCLSAAGDRVRLGSRGSAAGTRQCERCARPRKSHGGDRAVGASHGTPR